MYKLFALFLFATSAQAISPVSPDYMLTPGVIDPNATVEKICTPHYTETVRHVTMKTKKQVFKLYGIDPNSDSFEVDHLISLELGGSNDIKNLWPESYTTTPYNARDKDVLENRLHKLVCDGKISLLQAQTEIAKDWIKAHQDYIQQH
jgi:hypothetical protein